MALSPRKRATAPFDPARHETDAASFDPASLPVTRIPRAWERKPETGLSRDGKPKKVWRRYTTRSATANPTPTEDDEDEDEERDSRSRPVKKLQRMRPADMEHISALPSRRKRAYKATQWDRRKSVLPRKKASLHKTVDDGADEDTIDDEVTEGALDEMDASTGSVPEREIADQQEAIPILSSIVTSDRRRSSFAFRIEKTKSHDASGTSESLEENMREADVGREDSISTAESIPQSVSPIETTQNSVPQNQDVMYPSIGDGMEDAVVSTPVMGGTDEQTGTEIEQSHMSEVDAEQDLAEELTERDETGSPDADEENSIVASPTMGADEEIGEVVATENHDDVQYPNLEKILMDGADSDQSLLLDEVSVEQSSEPRKPLLEEEITDCVPDKMDCHEDTYMSDSTSELGDFSPNDVSNDPECEGADESSAEDFTEASLQLEILQDREISAPVAAVQEQQDSTADATTAGTDSVESTTPEIAGSNDIKCETSIMEPSLISGAEGGENIDQQVPYASPATKTSNHPLDDIADGLTLIPSLSTPLDYTGQMVRSPSPPPSTEYEMDDATTTMHLDDDTALLKDFLTRAAASKANKTATIARRTSNQNRRDSGAIRQALASPRKILEEKDPNSPSKYDNDATIDLSQTLTLNKDGQTPLSPPPAQNDAEGQEDSKDSKSSRRSTRTRKTRLPAPPSAPQQIQVPKNISVRRADGGEPIVLRKSDAQYLGQLTRTNTRKNKHGSDNVSVRLLKLNTEALSLAGQADTTTSSVEPQPGKKNVRWDETLAYYQEHAETQAYTLAEAESLATPDELSGEVSTPSVKSKLSKDKKSGTPRVRKVRGPGAANGTPGKGLLATAPTLPETLPEVEVRSPIKEKPQRPPKASSPIKDNAQRPPKASSPIKEKPQRLPKASKLNKLVLPPISTLTAASPMSLEPQISAPEVAPVGLGAEPMKTPSLIKERRSRLATPRKVKLPVPAPAVPGGFVDGKENPQQTLGMMTASPKKGLMSGSPKKGIVAGSPKKASVGGTPKKSIRLAESIGIASGTPRKGIKLPEAIVPPVVESALPRRRAGRRVL